MQEGRRGGGLGSADALQRLNYLTWFYAYLDSAQIGCAMLGMTPSYQTTKTAVFRRFQASAAEQGARRPWLLSDAESFGFHGLSLDPWLLWLSLPLLLALDGGCFSVLLWLLSVVVIGLGLLGSHWL